MAPTKKGAARREQILQALAGMLEGDSNQRITTAELAREVGFSEAALYRHFPSKAKMFDALLDYIDEVLFERINFIAREAEDITQRCHHILTLVLNFAEKNRGMCRLLTGEVLTGELARLRPRVQQIFERMETQLKHLLRTARATDDISLPMTASASAHLMMVTVEGRISRYSRSQFRHRPCEYWDEQWEILSLALFHAPRAHMAL